MRCNWLRWLWGLVPLGLLIFFTYANERDAIQADVTSRAQSALQTAGLGWAASNFDGRDGVIGGQAYEREDQARATEIVRSVWGVRVAEDRSALVAEAEEFVWSADRSDNTVRLTGFVPNKSSRGRVVSQVKRLFPGAAVIDDMKPARGAPPLAVWMGGVEFGLTQLTRLESGASVNLRDAAFEIDGRARTVRAFQQVRGALAGELPDGVRLFASRVTPPRISPFTWGARFDGSRLTLTGHAPDDEAKKALVAVGKETFPNASIVDRMQVAAGEPTGWRIGAEALIRALKPLSTADAKIRDGVITVSGLAEREETALSVGKQIDADVPTGFETTHDIKFVKPMVPTVQPYTTGVVVSDKDVRLTGHVPNQAQRQSLLDFVARRFPNRRIVDRLKIAVGQQPEWGTCLNQGLDALARVGNGAMRLSDKVMRLTGQTENEALARSLPGELRTATSRTCDTRVNLEVLRQPEPDLLWTAERSDSGIVLSGDVPDSATRNTLIERAQVLFPGATVEDRMRVVPGDGTRWQRVAATGLELLGELRSGQAQIDGQVLEINGEAPDAASAAAVKQRLRTALADGYRGTSDIRVRSDAMIWAEREAKRKAEEARKKADDAERQRIAAAQEAARARAAREAAQREAERKAAIEAERRREAEAQARRERERQAAATAAAAAAAARADAARRAAERERVEAERREAARRRAEAERRRRQQQREDERRIRLALAQARCEVQLEEVRSGKKIFFEVGKADIRQRSFGLLDRLAGALKTCENVTVEIAGHTDSQGTEERNERLSQRRADAVRQYLTRVGVNADQIEAVGYGEGTPIASNETPAGRAQNRRIEFNVQVDE